jgi:hypothetical protein
VSRQVRPRRTGRAGFTLVELLVAGLITLVVVGAIATVTGSAQDLFRAQPEAADLQQRLRVGAETVRRNLVMAGAGLYAGPAWGPLGHFLAPIMPYRAFGDTPDQAQGVFFRSDAVSFLYVPSTPSQTVLSATLPAGALDAQLASLPNCPAETSTQVCGFERGDRLLVFDDEGQWDVFSADQIGSGMVVLQHRGPPAVATYRVGTPVAEIRLGTYYLRTDVTAGTSQLMWYDGWVTDLPVIDDVVGMDVRYFGTADPPLLTGAPIGVPPGPWTTYGPAPPPLGATRGGWSAGENCTFLVAGGEHRPRLPTLAAPMFGEVELSPTALTDGPWCPDASAPNRYDADLLRVRRLQITLRVQAASAALRGPAGALFVNGGRARAGDRWVPDLEVELSIAPRNLNPVR